MAVLGGGAGGRCLHYEGGAWWVGSVPYERDPGGLSPLLPWETQGEGALCGPGRGTPLEQGHTGAFILGFPASRIVRKKFLLFRSYLIFVFCYRSQMGWDRKCIAFSFLPLGEDGDRQSNGGKWKIWGPDWGRPVLSPFSMCRWWELSRKGKSGQKPQTVAAFMTRDEVLPVRTHREGEVETLGKQLISCKTHGGFQRHWDRDCWGYGDPTVNSGIRGPRGTSMCSLERFLNSQIVLVTHTSTGAAAWEHCSPLALFSGFRGSAQRGQRWEEGCRHPLCVVLSHMKKQTKGAAAYTLNFVHFSSGGWFDKHAW